MLLIASVLVIAVLLGYVAGGRLRALEQLRLRWWWLAPLGLLMQLAPLPLHGHVDKQVSVGLLIASYPVLLAFVWRNIRLPGLPLMFIGLAMNLLVISVNDGMPVTRHALEASGQGNLLQDLIHHGGAKHHLAGPDDALLPLADVIAIGPPVRQVVSAGDLVVYAGLVWLIVAVMRRRPRETVPARPPARAGRSGAPRHARRRRPGGTWPGTEP
jgi:Family of unknown function (DUF5317)